MLQLGQHAGLALEARQPLGVVGEFDGQQFQRHVPAEAGVAGAHDLAHAALAQQGRNLVMGEGLGQIHGGVLRLGE